MPVDLTQPWTPPHDPLGAFCRDNHVALVPTGSGILDGLTFAAKDLFHVKGHRTGFGNPDWLRTHLPAEETAVAIERLLAAGARMVGKTYTDELAYSLTGENAHYGTPINPHCPDRVPGGSSNGSAVAVAGGLVDFAIGSDCGGSVRIPASYCGVLGIRPSHGRVPLTGAIPFASSFDVVGWFARDVRVFEAVGQVLLGDDDDRAPPSRLMIARDAFELLDPEVSEALKGAGDRLRQEMRTADEAVVSDAGLKPWMECFRVLQAAEIWANHGKWITTVRPKIGDGIRQRFEWASTVTPEQVTRARQVRQAVIERMDALLGPGDIVCLPTAPHIAPLRSGPLDMVENTYRYQAMCLLCIAGLAGLPQVSLPLAGLHGCPLGLSILGRRGSDFQLLRLAANVMNAPDRPVSPPARSP